MLKENERAMIKWMKVYLSKNAESFAKLMKRYGINPFFMKDDKKVFHFRKGREALSFVLSTGALAGYKKCFMEGFEKEVAPFHPPYAIPRFCILVGMKRF